MGISLRFLNQQGNMMPLSKSYILLLILLGLATATEAKSPRFTPSSFQLYYGGDVKIVKKMTEQLQTGQVIAIEIRALSKSQLKKLLDEANYVGAKVVGYVSIGELGHLNKKKFQKFAKDDGTLAKIVVNQNPEFQSQRVDVDSKVWRDFVHSQIEEIYKTGVHGLFLDTVDTADVYSSNKMWSIQRRIQSVNAMINFIREIKQKHPRKFLMQNRGLNIIGKEVFVGDATGKMIPGQHLENFNKGNPDFVLWEDAFSQTGDWAIAQQQKLIAIQKAGYCTVFTLGYKVNKISREEFLTKSKQHQFIPAWATSSSTIHQELAH